MEPDKVRKARKTLRQWGEAKFPDSERLLKGHEFRYMRNNSTSVAGKMMILNYAKAPDGKRRIGIIVSKRYDRKAVQRKRACRIIREAYRLIKSRVKDDIWIVIVARNYLHRRKAFEVQEEILNLLKQENLVETDKGDY